MSHSVVIPGQRPTDLLSSSTATTSTVPFVNAVNNAMERTEALEQTQIQNLFTKGYSAPQIVRFLRATGRIR